MKKSLLYLLFFTTLIWGVNLKSFAVSPTTVTNVAVSSQTGVVAAGTAGSATYTLTLTFSNPSTGGSGLPSTLSLTNWTPPTGVTTSFSVNPVIVPGSPSIGIVSGGFLTIYTTALTPAGVYTFNLR